MRLTAIFLSFALGAMAADDEGAFPGAPELAGALVQHFAYLYPGGDVSEADTVNRDLREARESARRATDDATRQAAATKRAAAAERLASILAACPKTIDVDLAEGRPVLDIGTVKLPGTTAALLLRVNAGEGPPRCRSFEYNFARLDPTRIQIADGCVSWVVVVIKNVPTPEATLSFEIAAQPAEPTAPVSKSTTLLARFASTPPGTLDVTILSDDTGKPVPAMVRLVRKMDGQEIAPSSAVDFAPQFDQQGNYAGPRRSNIPGALAGAYYCTAGPFRMSVAPGDYDIVIHRGVEHVAVFDSFTVESDQPLKREYRPRRWTDLRKTGWYSGDDHVHCQVLSDDDASRLMTWAQAEDVHLCNVVKMGDIYRTWFPQRGFGREFRIRDGDYILCPGQESPRTHNELGHTLQMNIKSIIYNPDQYYLYDLVFDEAHAQGGLSGYAHVNSGIFHVNRDMTMNIAKGKIDFVELLQFTQLGTDLYYDFLNTGFPVTASAGSDVPWGGSIGEVRVYAHCGRKFTADRWFEAVRKGNTFVTNGIMLDFRVEDSLPGDEIRVDRDTGLRVRARAWGDAERAVPVKLEIVVHGDVLEHVEQANANQSELSLDFTVPSGHGFWIAARAEGSDGSRAHSTPVYVVREGLRFWKYDALDELFAKRETSLSEIEQIVADAVQRNERGEVELNKPIRELAEQSPALLERVNESRAIYGELKKVAEAERALRR